MPIRIIRQGITKIKADAVVNPTNEYLIPGGGVDAAIHEAAGPKLAAACAKLNGCEVGKAKITPGFGLPCKYIIHTVGPVWKDGESGECEMLRSCYRESLRLAKEKKCRTAAFPLISSGTYGYPKDRALKTAMSEIGAFLEFCEMTVYIVVYDKTSYSFSEQLTADITSYIDDHYVEEHENVSRERISRKLRNDRAAGAFKACEARDNLPDTEEFDLIASAPQAPTVNSAISLEEALEHIDESFSEMLLRKIDESGMKDSQCYKKANIDRKLFSKIRSDRHYKPSKTTVLAFAVALELSLDETAEMLMKAGFALSKSNKFDIIIRFFIERGNYNVYEINEALFAFDQPMLGA